MTAQGPHIPFPEELLQLAQPGSIVQTTQYPTIAGKTAFQIPTTPAVCHDMDRLAYIVIASELPTATKQIISGLHASVISNNGVTPAPAGQGVQNAQMTEILESLKEIKKDITDMKKDIKDMKKDQTAMKGVLDHANLVAAAKASNQAKDILLQPLLPLPVRPGAENQLPRTFVDRQFTTAADIAALEVTTLDAVLRAYGLDGLGDVDHISKARLIWVHLGGK